MSKGSFGCGSFYVGQSVLSELVVGRGGLGSPLRVGGVKGNSMGNYRIP